MSVISHESRFSMAPVNNISRSIFDRSNSLVTSFSAGKLIPIYCEDVLPGDTCTMDLSSLVRMATPLYPVLDTAWMDIHWFFVPLRLLWDNFKYFMGESQDAWTDDIEYQVPQVVCTPGPHTVSGYFGLPLTFSLGNPLWCEVNALPFRAYQLIWNEWFRDENLQDPVLINKGDTVTGGIDDLLPVNKYHDYFTSCLPQPQKGQTVFIPGGTGGDFPVYALDKNVPSFNQSNLVFGSNGGFGSQYSFITAVRNGGDSNIASADLVGTGSSPIGKVVYPLNLWARASDNAEGGTINQLREAFAVQRFLERDARGGTRYRELVKAHFGTDVGDARVQVPEYLGGAHVPINIMQVVQQSSTSGEPSPLGEVGAMSKTVHNGSMFTKSFTEHGLLMGFVSIRTDHSYLQGIPRMFSRKTRYDYYWPELANIGEQAVMTREIFAGADEDDVFGYQEAWAEYRYKPNQITGKMAYTTIANDLGANTQLSPWHYGDYYASAPDLSDGWIRETDVNVGRTLAVSNTELFDQFIANFYFKAKWARPMPLYSIPSLNGHI